MKKQNGSRVLCTHATEFLTRALRYLDLGVALWRVCETVEFSVIRRPFLKVDHRVVNILGVAVFGNDERGALEIMTQDFDLGARGRQRGLLHDVDQIVENPQFGIFARRKRRTRRRRHEDQMRSG